MGIYLTLLRMRRHVRVPCERILACAYCYPVRVPAGIRTLFCMCVLLTQSLASFPGRFLRGREKTFFLAPAKTAWERGYANTCVPCKLGYGALSMRRHVRVPCERILMCVLLPSPRSSWYENAFLHVRIC